MVVIVDKCKCTNGHVGMFVKLNAGLCKITSVTNSTVAVANVIEDMADTQGAW